MEHDLKRLVMDLLQQQIPPAYKAAPLVEESKLPDYGLDSLNMMSFWVALERKGPPGIDIGRLDFAAMDTVDDVLQHVKRLCELIPSTS